MADNDSKKEEDLPDRPNITEAYTFVPDPVRAQKKKDAPPRLKLETIPEKESIISAKIQPSIGTRLDLQYVKDVNFEEGQPRPKYVIPRTRKQQRAFEKNRANTSKKFCKYGYVKIPEPIPEKKVNDFEIPSPEVSKAKVTPRKVTPTASWLYPYPQTKEELELKKPRSGIFINEKDPKKVTVYDSFDLVFAREEAQKKKKSKKRRRPGRDTLEDISEEGEETAGKSRKKKRRKRKKDQKVSEKGEAEETEKSPEELFMEMLDEQMAEEYMGEGTDLKEYLTKQFRRKVSQISKATSYQSKDICSVVSEEVLEEPLHKYAQKFRRESEIKRYEPKKRKIKRGTLESHSFTSIYQPTLKDFFFGSKEGTMHQGDEHFPAAVRNNQGICMSVAAYCFSIIKHPNKWNSENIDEILDMGNNLALESAKKLHIHNLNRELQPKQLQKYCTIGEKKIRFVVDEPEVSGLIRSDDKRVYNLTKALNIFFARQSSGILKTQDTSIAIWKDRYFYFYDAKPRTKDLFYSSNGAAIMANFYDIPALVTVFLDRSNFGNWPFVIYTLKAFKILNKDDPEVDSKIELDVRSNYNILNENKAVVLASFDLADKCFDFSRNKQSLPMAVTCLVYSRITPPSAWHKTTLDKIMIIGNQLYLECMECESIVDLRLDSIPAIFTIGPYIIEIYIYANVFVDLMYKKCCCQLMSAFEDFFEKSTNAVLQIERCTLAVWKQRGMFYCFDPYSRNGEGFRCRDGTACVSMHSNLESLVATITVNFDSKDSIFYLHALKVCKIHRDPVQTLRFPKHLTMDDYPLEEFKNYKMKKSRKPATEKPVTVDYSALAMKRLLAGESPENSIYEIGSTVESLAMEQIPPMVRKFPSKCYLKAELFPADAIADLDSPSLSDTQIEPPLPEQPKFGDEIEFLDLESFELTQDEIELQMIEPGGEAEGEGYGEGEGEDEYRDLEGEFAEGGEGEGEEDYDWYYAKSHLTQVGEFSLPKQLSKISEEVNTDITYFPINKEILYPTYVRDRQRMKKQLQGASFKDDDWDTFLPSEPEVTKSQELRKETNFIDLPDDTQIVYGTKNIAEFGRDIEFIAPFVCIMACVVSRKYSILSWSGDIVDYILKCGNELYRASKFRYDQVSKLEIPRITLGNANFKVLVEYIFDTYTRQNILELAIEKILFVRSDMGVLVTPTYACGLLYKNHLYYMYDGFGNNEVGLSEGPSNTGTACFARFKDIHALTTRIMYNKRKRESQEEVIYSRFVLSSVKAKIIHPSQDDIKKKKKKRKTDKEKEEEMNDEKKDEAANDDEEPKAEQAQELSDQEGEEEEGDEEGDKKEGKKPKNKVGYQYQDGLYLIEGTKALKGKKIVSEELKEDHFVCICASLMLMTCPVQKWDTVKVNQVIDHGMHVYSHADDLEISEKRTIKNILIEKNFFDIIVKQIKIENWKDNKNISLGIDTLLRKKLAYFLVQFSNACYVIHQSADEIFHIFDPYGFTNKGKAGWVKCQNLKIMKRRLKRLIISGGESYSFYNFEVTSIQKAPKEVLISHRLQEYDLESAEKKEQLGKPFYEDTDWLKADPVPWSRKANKSANGKSRGKVDNLWHDWDVEYPKDLFSLLGNIHQSSDRFSEKSRGKQTLANLVIAIGMMDIYDLAEWNSAVVDSILVNGDNYFTDCVQDINDEDYEISMDDLKEECSIFPFSFNVTFTPVVEGTMFLVRSTQFNLYKALRYFFNNVQRRCGIICSTRSEGKRQVAFGKLYEFEYFMFDSAAQGTPMFLENTGVAYVLRMTTLNRLLHVLTLTLRGGDFYIYDVEIADLKPLS